MSNIVERRNSTSTDVTDTDTDTASFVTPLATPSHLSQFPSQLELSHDKTPRKAQDNRSDRSGTVTPIGPEHNVAEERPVTAVYSSPAIYDPIPRPLSRDVGTDTASLRALESDAEEHTEKNLNLLALPGSQEYGPTSKGTTLGGDSAQVSEKETATDSDQAEHETVAAPGDPTGTTTGIATGATETNEEEVVYPGGLTLGLITTGLLLATFVVALDNTIIATAIPQITTVFNSLGDVGWYGSSYLLCTTSLQPTFGKIYSFFNIKYTYLAALAIFEVGSIVCALAKNSVMLIVGRAIAGLGAAGLFSGGMTIIGFTVPLQKRAIFIALLSSMFGVASVVGPLIGGVFTDAPNLTWRWCFWINLPFGAVALLTVFIFFKNPKRKDLNLTFKQKLAEMDLIGAGVLIGGIVCLLLALQWGGTTYAWSDSKVWGCLLGFGLLISLFIGLQLWQGEKATIPPRILKQRTVAAGCTFSALIAMAIYATIYFLPFYFQAVKGTSAEGSGIRTIPYLVSNTLASIVVGTVITVTGYYVPFLWTGSAIFAAGCGVLYLLKVDDGPARWIGYQLLAGIGAGTCIQIPFISVQVVLSPKDMPTGNALTIFFNTLGGALSISIAQNIFSNTLVEKLQSQLPGSLPYQIIAAGATHVREVTPPQYLDIVLEAYNSAIIRAFILPIAVACIAFLVSLAFEWKNMKGKKISMGAGA